MFFVIYSIYKVWSIYLAIKSLKDTNIREKISYPFVIFLPILLYVALYIRGEIIIWTFIVTIFVFTLVLIISKNKTIKLLSALDMVELFTIYIPSVYEHFTSGMFGISSGGYDVYFLCFKIFEG